MLSYCTNLHPADDLDGILTSVLPQAARVRQILAWPTLGLDLFLPPAAIAALKDCGTRDQFRRALDDQHLIVTSLNGFPLIPFQVPVIKDRVYRPDWTQPERLQWSLDLLSIAADLINGPAVISSLPGSFGAWNANANLMAENLGRWAAAAARLDRKPPVILALEPEPCCFLSTATEAQTFFHGPLAQAGLAACAQALDGDLNAARNALKKHLGICQDTSHAAVLFDEESNRLHSCGAGIVKLQLSAAPECNAGDPVALKILQKYDEPRFLHQCAVKTRSGAVFCAQDLPDLPKLLDQHLDADLVRCHFHLPLSHDPEGIRSTRVEALNIRRPDGIPVSVETYTWPLLRPGDLCAAIAAELAVVASNITS